ncbi:response regulator [Flavobacterium paronense]|uniref:Response regulator n=1 Tax=Flavobacterium paronense TaxID=1392775 RepID=A0ABV5GCP6_9FLAO|nr:response regulator [Flavobacterium paronense]MDN3676276.1 response regulator [Flavobacterium paronense]
MFKRVLLAEDIDSINIAVIQTLHELGVTQIDHVKYCDDALLKIRKATADQTPYDLFISDLSFEADHREVKLKSGEEAIQQIRILQPDIKIIVYSVENKRFKIKALFEKSHINGYVLKGRDSINQLKSAIKKVYEEDAIYLSPSLEHLMRASATREIDDYDVKIIQQLAVGITQDDLEARFKELGILPNSKSTIEKHISKLKDHFSANNTVHLIAIAKDLGIA